MKILNLQRFSKSSLLHQLFCQLGGTISVNENETILKVDNKIATGTINQFILRNGLMCFNFNVTFHTNIIVNHISKNGFTYDFIYASISSFFHNFGRDGKIIKIRKFETAIFCSGNSLESMLHFAKNKMHILSIISVNTNNKKNKEEANTVLIHKLKHTFKLNETNISIAYIGPFNLEIADKIQQLQEISHKGIVQSLLLEALIITILALKIRQHSKSLRSRSLNFGSLSTKEMTIIRELSTFIKNHPENEYSILSICLQSGLSKAKLQEGFKLMHKLTVTQYIRDVRILAAEHLIKTTDLNISEIVYSIGLTSRSYFSKIFKEKYKCSPKNYQDNQQLSSN